MKLLLINSPKDLGEVDYTEAESNILQAISANRNREINPNDTFKSHSKRQLLISLQEFGLDKAFDYGRCQYLRSQCTGVLYPLSRLLKNWATPGCHTLYNLTDPSVLVHALAPVFPPFLSTRVYLRQSSSRRSFADTPGGDA